LNVQQVMTLAMSGHNVFIGGKPGTGKTYTVKRVVNSLKQTRNVKVTCTTRMACSLYDKAMTIHSFSDDNSFKLSFSTRPLRKLSVIPAW
jgi:Cdc6-like AAA superfamily ATPase